MSSDLAEKARKVADRWYVNKDTSLQSLLAIQILSALREAVEAEREATIKAICEAFQHREPSIGEWLPHFKVARDAIQARGKR